MPSNEELTWQQYRDKALEEQRKDRVKPLTKNQGTYLDAMKAKRIVICTGPAGSGKTWMACGYAAQLLQEGKVKGIVLSRPMVACGKDMGWFPGGPDEKFGPYVEPLLDAFEDFFDSNTLAKYLSNGVIRMTPLSLMRGKNIRDSFIICDESQNWEGMNQAHMLFTRLAKGTRLVVTGDVSRTQTDTSMPGLNPLAEAVLRIKLRGGHPVVQTVELTRDDIVREEFIGWLDETFSTPLRELEAQKEAVKQDGPWFDVRCQSCKTWLAYEDADDSVQEVECFSCRRHTALWDDTAYEPRLVPKGHEATTHVAETFPDKP